MQKKIFNYFLKIEDNKNDSNKSSTSNKSDEKLNEKCSNKMNNSKILTKDDKIDVGKNKIKEQDFNMQDSNKIETKFDGKLNEKCSNKMNKSKNLTKSCVEKNKTKEQDINVPDTEDLSGISKNNFKRLRFISDDESKSDSENIFPSPIHKKSKLSKTDDQLTDPCSILRRDLINSLKENAASTPKKSKFNIERRQMNSETKNRLFSFSKNANESCSELNESQIVENELCEPVESYDHLSYDFLRKENIRDLQKRKPDHPEYDSSSLWVPESFMTKLTPGLKQWWKIKSNGNMDTIIFFKVGKFYELYHMDAVIAINELGLSQMRGSYAHSGFPEIAFAKMADQLVLKGYKVARVEQTETVEAMAERIKHDGSKNRVVNREVCQVITPGTRGFSLRNKTCREPGQGGNEELGYIEDAGGLLIALRERAVDLGPTRGLRSTANIGVAIVNTNTGKFTIAQFADDDHRSRFRTLLSRFVPNEIVYLRGNLSRPTQHVLNTGLAATRKECLSNETQFLSSETTLARLLEIGYFSETSSDKLSRHGLPVGLNEALDPADNLGRSARPGYELAISCVGALLYYLERCLIDRYLVSLADFTIHTPADGCDTTTLIESSDRPFYEHQHSMILDSNTLTNLDILQNSSLGGTDGTLLERLDFSSTRFGRRLLVQWISTPLCQPQAIVERQEAIAELIDCDSVLGPIKSVLKALPDLEKLVAKIHVLGLNKLVADHPDSRAVLYDGLVYSRRKIGDFVAALTAFDDVMEMQRQFSEQMAMRGGTKSILLRRTMLRACEDEVGQFPDIGSVIDFFQNAFNTDKAKADGKIVPEKGVDPDFDSAMATIKDIDRQLQQYLDTQKRIIGCQMNFFGTGKNRYQLEIPESKCSKVPNTYIVSSQKKGFKRYLTSEIEELLESMIRAEDKRDAALQNIMCRLFAKFDEHYTDWSRVVSSIAQLDVLLCLASFSRGLDGGPMTTPDIRPVTPDTKPFLEIREGRFPCRARTVTGQFISNSTLLGDRRPVLLLTGPNMGGKSTLMRQTALLVVLAQLGCNVPAEGPVVLTPVDRLLTRQGARDALEAGQSTLRVEMEEVALTLTYMTEHSLLLVDELGRGTATHDGCALAFSILSSIARSPGPRAIFSTHFHKLLEEHEIVDAVQIGHMACMVEDEDEDTKAAQHGDLQMQNITFLYKLVEGGCPHSYGFNAARLAGIPEQIILSGLDKARLFEEETLISEFSRCLELPQSQSVHELAAWQQRFKKLYRV